MLLLVPSFGSWSSLTGTLSVLGIAQAAQFTVFHVRVIKAAQRAPAFAAPLNIWVANIGIAVGAIIGGGVVITFGVERLGLVGAGIIAVAAPSRWLPLNWPGFPRLPTPVMPGR